VRPHALVRIDEGGALNWATLALPAASGSGPAAALAWDVRVGAVEVEQASARLEDRTTEPDEFDVDFRHLEMTKLTPYSAEFAGHEIDSGILDLDIHYRIEDLRLVGEHRVVASDLVLGAKVEGSSGAGVPVRLAVALLKDKDGRIDLEVPVEGTIDSPAFAYRKVFWQASKKILGHIATAPFRALGRLFGRDDEDLELVEFDPGRSDLLPAEQEKRGSAPVSRATRVEVPSTRVGLPRLTGQGGGGRWPR